MAELLDLVRRAALGKRRRRARLGGRRAAELAVPAGARLRRLPAQPLQPDPDRLPRRRLDLAGDQDDAARRHAGQGERSRSCSTSGSPRCSCSACSPRTFRSTGSNDDRRQADPREGRPRAFRAPRDDRRGVPARLRRRRPGAAAGRHGVRLGADRPGRPGVRAGARAAGGCSRRPGSRSSPAAAPA